MFNENSALVQIWVRLIKQGAYTTNHVPNLSNLQDVIASILISGNEQAQKAEAFDYLVEGENDYE